MALGSTFKDTKPDIKFKEIGSGKMLKLLLGKMVY